MTNPTEAPMANAIDDVKLTSEAEVFRTMHVLLEGIAQIAENHGFERGDDLMVWLAKTLPSASPAPSQHTGWSDEAVQCDRCQGNGEIVTDWDRYMRPNPGDVGDEAVAQCPDCNGEGSVSNRAALAASSIAPATGFEVKDLAWQLTGPPGSDIEASTAIGVYTINRDDLSAGGGYNLWMAGETNDDIFTSFHSLLEAKAAAQADFDRRIRSSISPSVAKESGAVDENDWSFQQRVGGWMRECFTPDIIADKLERNDRFIEEALELVQSLNYSADRAHALVDYVFGRDEGEPNQEVGGVMVTLAALCNPNGLNMDLAAETELARILDPAIVLKIRAKQASKPTGSALPIPPKAAS